MCAVVSAWVWAPSVASQSAECVPQCRTGYVCSQGQCVSACNPPCPSGTQCTDALQCEPVDTRALERAAAEREEEGKRGSEYRHDGFYLRFGIAAGYPLDFISRRGEKVESSGFGAAVHYAVGTTINGNLVLALAHRILRVFSASTTIDGVALDHHASDYQLFGILADIHPDPAAGLHFGVLLGFGSADIVIDDIADEYEREVEASDEYSGFNFGFHAGYDFWVGTQWSLGATLELYYLTGAEDNFGEHDAFVPILALSALWH